ncbi:MAG: tRNA (adenosine(37)-N6)-threonylcarbamoyltransferase complex dimerization subunit type 1 TsaB [Planctomycetia bacterium]|nr:tRNA (adenosine(37)-N6)-threonylcarbamoyltransferase complex dimerization subunit type 1 TsaB [Planctomycetia bacterium]
MRILALETSEISGSLAIGECSDGTNGEPVNLRTVATVSLPAQERSARSLAPAIDTTLRQAGWTAGELDVIGISIGPGSFTGLRVGLATAKMIAWAVNARIVAIDTRDAIAQRFFRIARPEQRSPGSTLAVWIDAQRGQTVTAVFQNTESSVTSREQNPVMAPATTHKRNSRWSPSRSVPWKRLTSTDRPICVDEALATIPEPGRTWLAGSFLSRPSVLAKLPEPVRSQVVENALSVPDASGVLELTAVRANQGRFDDLHTLIPLYSRPSAATERIAGRDHVI